MTKKIVVCPICKVELGKFHNNASSTPVRDHIYANHWEGWEEIVSLVEEIRSIQNKLKNKYDIGYWDMSGYHNRAVSEIDFKNRPPLTKEQIDTLQKKILNSE